MEIAARNLVIEPMDLLAFEIEPGISFWDLIVASRVFQLIRAITSSKLVPCIQNEPKVVFQSLVPVLRRDLLERLIGEVVGAAKAKPLIEIMTTDLQGSNVDIQYRPLVPVGDEELWAPPNVFSNSNVLRNPFINSNKRIYNDGKKEPDVEMLRERFKNAGFSVAPTIKYEFAGDEGELDVVAYSKDYIFVLECKNPLLPTSSHELIQSFDHIQKASSQLERFSKHFASDAFRKQIESKAGFRIEGIPKVVTGIVLSNRMFQGYRHDGPPVRGLYEFLHYLEAGDARIGDERRSYWIGDSLTEEDVRIYLEEDNTYVDQWASLSSFYEKYILDEGVEVRVERLALDNRTIAEKHGFEDVPERINEQQKAFEDAFSEFSIVDDHKQRYDKAKKNFRRKRNKDRNKKLKQHIASKRGKKK